MDCSEFKTITKSAAILEWQTIPIAKDFPLKLFQVFTKISFMDNIPKTSFILWLLSVDLLSYLHTYVLK